MISNAGQEIVMGGARPMVWHRTPAITPSDLANLYAWWKADAITGLSNNQSIVTIPDSSGNGRTLGGGGTLYKTNVQNSLPGIFFDGVNDTINETGFSYGVSTLIWVSNLTQGGVLFWGEGTSSREDYIASGGDSRATANRTGTLWGYGYPATWLDGLGVFAVQFAATAGNSFVRKNGVAVAPSDDGLLQDLGTQSITRSIWIGSRDGDFPIGGHLLEMMIFTGEKTLREIRGLEEYARQKWTLY